MGPSCITEPPGDARDQPRGRSERFEVVDDDLVRRRQRPGQDHEVTARAPQQRLAGKRERDVAEDGAQPEQAAIGSVGVLGEDRAQRPQRLLLELPGDRLPPIPCRVRVLILLGLSDDRVPLHLAVRGPTKPVGDSGPTDRILREVAGGMEDARIGVVDHRDLLSDPAAESALKRRLDPRSRRGTIDQAESTRAHGGSPPYADGCARNSSSPARASLRTFPRTSGVQPSARPAGPSAWRAQA
jgi:hypothetical protein